jgi:protein arginine kinase activator
MICEHCHNEQANVFVTQVINNNKVELHLCSKCAAILQSKIYTEDSFQQFLTGLLKLQGTEADIKPYMDKICPNCNMTLEEFRKKSKLGCEKCYTEFRPYVNHIVKSIHGGNKHVGKQPLRLYKKDITKDKISELEAKLKLALMQEDYLEAASIRDALVKLREEA